VNRWHRIASHSRAWFLVLVLLGALVVTAITYVKLGSLFAWRYTSDLFVYDQILTETLAGHPGIDYTYGQELGEHAYLMLFVLLPVKAVCGARTILFLLLLSTLVYFVSVLVVFVSVRRLTESPVVAFLTGCAFLLTHRVAQALYCAVYGNQVLDNPAGFVAVVFAFALAVREKCSGSLKGFLAWYVPFLLLREDMAVLGVIYFGIVWLFARKRVYLVTLACTLAVAMAEFWLVSRLATPMNRGIRPFLTDFFGKMGSHQAFELLGRLPPTYVISIIGFVWIMILAIVLSRGPSAFAVALFAVGLCKIGFGYVAQDTDLATWHNHPGIVMMTGAVLLQVVSGGAPAKTLKALVGGAAALSLASAAWLDLPFLVAQARQNSRMGGLVGEYRVDLLSTMRAVPRAAVVAIPPWTAVEWTLRGHPRFSFYPRGVSWPPEGIADYVVLEKPGVAIRNQSFTLKTQEEVVKAHPEFSLADENEHFWLLKRTRVNRRSRQGRQKWIDSFGRESLGL
jgi:hypothetical protein